MITEKYVIKNKRKLRIRRSIRSKIQGTAQKPRLIIFRSNKFLYAQVYDDLAARVLAHVSTREMDMNVKLKSFKDKAAAKVMGKLMADRLKKLKIKAVVFDRNVYDFKGRVKIFADSVRENGIKI
jgi:large subunit ribosomal protein L18